MKHLPTATLLIALVPIVLGGCDVNVTDNPSNSPSSDPTAIAGTDDQPCGQHKINGIQVYTFCGPGTVSIGDTRTQMTIARAECITDRDGFHLNAGTIVLDPMDVAVRAHTQYVGLAVPSKKPIRDGISSGKISGNNQGQPLGANEATTKIKLAAGATTGAGSGPSLTGGGTVTVTFKCGSTT